MFLFWWPRRGFVVESEPPVRVILDMGAQVLDWKNEEVVRQWLSHVPEAQAAVVFDDRNDLSVLSHDGVTESLMISPFAKQMDQCLVYLDVAHTRGTDLELPTNYQAAVTLGPDLTNDRLGYFLTTWGNGFRRCRSNTCRHAFSTKNFQSHLEAFV